MTEEDAQQEFLDQPPKLQLKKRVVEEEEMIAPPPPPKKKQKKHSSTKPGKASGRFGMKFLGMSIGTFLVASAVFGLFLYHQVNGLTILTPKQADMTRGMTVVIFFGLLVVEAFSEDMLQGILSLFLPPYAFVYGLFFADAGPVRGLTMAMLLFLGAEVYVTPEDALVPNTVATLNEWVESGQQKLINPDKPNAGFNE